MSNILVKIDAIQGDATLTGYEGQIECMSMRHAIDLPVVSGDIRVEGTSRHGPIELMHTVDKATPALKLAASMGTNLGTVTITRMRMIGGQSRPVETVKVGNAFVVRVDVDTPIDSATNEPADEPMETFSLEYSDIVWDQKYYVNDVERGSVQGSWSSSTQSTSVSL